MFRHGTRGFRDGMPCLSVTTLPRRDHKYENTHRAIRLRPSQGKRRPFGGSFSFSFLPKWPAVLSVS